MTALIDVGRVRVREAAAVPSHRVTVRRPRLLQALACGRPLVALVAPAGYGKTTLLQHWCETDGRPAAWLRLDRRHEDPLALLRDVARAADTASRLVIDDVHELRSPASHEVLRGISRQPPPGMTIAFASRAELPLPVARLQAE